MRERYLTPLEPLYAPTWRERMIHSPVAWFVVGLVAGVAATLVLVS